MFFWSFLQRPDLQKTVSAQPLRTEQDVNQQLFQGSKQLLSAIYQ
jgi:hypothetical protein